MLPVRSIFEVASLVTSCTERVSLPSALDFHVLATEAHLRQ
jgi:hypothetical protein